MTAHPGHRPPRGFWHAWYWISWVICVVLGLLGLVAVIAAFWVPEGAWVVLLPVGTILLLVATVIGWQLVTTALAVTLDAHGTLLFRRVRGVLRTHATRVRRSVFVSDPYTPTVIETADGAIMLIHTRPDVADLVSAIRCHRPDLAVDL